MSLLNSLYRKSTLIEHLRDCQSQRKDATTKLIGIDGKNQKQDYRVLVECMFMMKFRGSIKFMILCQMAEHHSVVHELSIIFLPGDLILISLLFYSIQSNPIGNNCKKTNFCLQLFNFKFQSTKKHTFVIQNS